ncbi:hypothetical protein CAPTEDRAFT_94500 [Capitella teleta]|uniref:Calponin-homology (CH) domain-containing protein n=1 Tax=Capitella teleta TaxID=283909 RepID=R7UM21_CAPTE|nr:hypothetical protein CAPTEDRAFT_94500 [Capitella teleta]|eukprot:ELU07549.1 hypothetical protein CAPTEDRAFT_94500 [Capitella teleta]
MKGSDDRWVQIQLSTFANWVNEQLRNMDMSVQDIRTDFADGIKLCSLIQVLQGKSIGRVIKKPLNQHHYLENVSLALKAITQDNIKLVNIGEKDVVNGHQKLIMGLLWHLILRYQIGKSKVPPKKLMLAWINAILPSLKIKNFSSDWNDGMALHALIEYCKPGTCPNWKQLNRNDRLSNCRRALELAKQNFGIPLVLSAENLSSPDLDELSGMTYLSYFMKVDSPGYNATLNWVRQQIPNSNVKNFQTAWNDGQALLALTESLGGKVDKDHIDSTNHTDVIQNGAYSRFSKSIRSG